MSTLILKLYLYACLIPNIFKTWLFKLHHVHIFIIRLFYHLNERVSFIAFVMFGYFHTIYVHISLLGCECIRCFSFIILLKLFLKRNRGEKKCC